MLPPCHTLLCLATSHHPGDCSFCTQMGLILFKGLQNMLVRNRACLFNCPQWRQSGCFLTIVPMGVCKNRCEHLFGVISYRHNLAQTSCVFKSPIGVTSTLPPFARRVSFPASEGSDAYPTQSALTLQ